MGLGVRNLPAEHPPDHRRGDVVIPRALGVLIVVGAGAAWLAPWPPALVERYYATGVYGRLQPAVTAASDLVPWAVLDLQVAAVAVAVVAGLARWARRRRRRAAGSGRHAWRRLAGHSVVAVAAAYLVFLAMWGLNYRRAPVETRLDFDERRVTAPRILALAHEATAVLNTLHARAHASSWPLPEALPTTFGPRLAAVSRQLGLGWTPRPGRPKVSHAGPYFQWASIAGMTNPFALEILPSPETLPFERHAVVAHEWAHLAGFAHEAEASFVGWLICLGGDDQARYSGWFGVWAELVGALGRPEREQVMKALAEGPRHDLRAVVARNARAVPAVREAAWRGYDAYLRSQHVPEGVASYAGVVRLLAGTLVPSDPPK